MSLRQQIIIGAFVFLQATGAITEKYVAAKEPVAEKQASSSGEDPLALSVTDFLPKGYVSDGSVSYQKEIQNAINAASEQNGRLVFPPGTFSLDEKGLQVHSNLTLLLGNATFEISKECSKDGHAFWGRDVESVRFQGGTVIGHNDTWKKSVNIGGVRLQGKCREVRVSDMTFQNLSSNGVGVFGDQNSRSSDIWITDTVIDNCCNFYGDYQSKPAGRARGSDRKDQGGIALYYVDNFVVRGCRLERSQSDGTHFYRCKDGQFIHNRVNKSQMGGYFLETCVNVLASDNLIQDNGSRGVTIERKSIHCTLIGNVISGSGREGVWAPGCRDIVIANNIILKNGRKPNAKGERKIWNANIKINEDLADPKSAPASNYLVTNNIIETTESQVAAIRIVAGKTTRILLKDNLLSGKNQIVQVLGNKNAVVKGGGEN